MKCIICGQECTEYYNVCRNCSSSGKEYFQKEIGDIGNYYGGLLVN
jgi:hypothetical protein